MPSMAQRRAYLNGEPPAWRGTEPYWIMIGFRQAAATAIDALLIRRLAPLAAGDWRASAVLFAPHPDDETLGCGGLVAKKIAAGADVRFVFVTDGSASHAGHAAAGRLRERREDEARAAVSRLGADAGRATFLRLPDGRAREHIPEIAAAAASLLAIWQPECVLIPHRLDPTPDHVAVHAGVSAALRDHGQTVVVLEYPIWLWYHWPWVRLRSSVPGLTAAAIRQTLTSAAGLRLLSAFNAMAFVADASEAKCAALAAHASQMSKPADNPNWVTLPDLSDGDFVRRLLADHELFLRRVVNPRG